MWLPFTGVRVRVDGRRVVQVIQNLVDNACKYTDKGDPHANLTRAADKLRPGESGLVALDWNNGNRCVLADQRLTGYARGRALNAPDRGYAAGR